jgi:hypothetical protein
MKAAPFGALNKSARNSCVSWRWPWSRPMTYDLNTLSVSDDSFQVKPAKAESGLRSR